MASDQHESKNITEKKRNDHVVFYEADSREKDGKTWKNTSSSSKAASGKAKKTLPPRSGSGKPKKPTKLSKLHILLNVIACLLALCLIGGGTILLMMFSLTNSVHYQELPDDSESTSSKAKKSDSSVLSGKIPSEFSGEASSTDPGIKPYEGDLLDDPMVLNIMLFGEDTRENSSTGNSDTMLIFSIDTRHKKLKMLSLLRDTYVEIPGYGENRLNAAYAFGGAALTIKTVQLNYGIKIDRYAVVNFESFRNIINTLGGLTIELAEEEIDYINWQSWINQQDAYRQAEGDYKEAVREQLRYTWSATVPEWEKPLNKTQLSFHQNAEGKKAATVHLNGQQALWHARNRGEDGVCSGDDFVRTQRQRQVISTLINDLKKVDAGKLISIIYEVGPMITTNLKASQMVSLAAEAAKNYIKYPIVSDSAPNLQDFGSNFYFSDPYENPVYIYGNFASVILVRDWNEFRKQIALSIFEDQVEVETTNTSG